MGAGRPMPLQFECASSPDLFFKFFQIVFGKFNGSVKGQCHFIVSDCLLLEFSKPQDLETFRDAARLPSGLVMTLQSAARLEKFKDIVITRGLKNKSKGLSDYLKNPDPAKIPLITGTYTSAGRAEQGMRTMIGHAASGDGPALFILGIDAAVFDDLWAKSAKHNLLKYRSGKIPADVTSDDIDISSWLLDEFGIQFDVPPDLCDIYIGNSDEVDLVRRLIIRATENNTPILILGDTGTGKEIVARQIHRRSDRQNGPFIPVNCGGIPNDLLESELFGHMEGSFTGATRDKVGLWQAASEGTLFLDEIGELSRVNQAKILRVLEDGRIRRVGGTNEIKVNARVIAATNRDLFNMVQAGRFREDLYYRLSGFFIRTPALKDHPEDIPLIAQFLWKKITGDPKRRLPQEMLKELSVRNWPGNVRELKMVLNRLFNLFPNENLAKQHLRGVSYLAERSDQSSLEPVTDKDLILHRAHCLSHLKRAHEVIDATEHILKKALSKKQVDARTADRLMMSLNLRIHEFEKLCRTPLLFHGRNTFTEVNKLRGRITWLLGLQRKNRREAVTYWKMEVTDSFRTAFQMIFSEIEKLLAES